MIVFSGIPMRRWSSMARGQGCAYGSNIEPHRPVSTRLGAAIPLGQPSSTVEQLLSSSLQQELHKCRTYGDFRVVIEDHLSYLNDQQTSRVLKHLTDFVLRGGADRRRGCSQQQLHALLGLLSQSIRACVQHYTPRQVASTLSSFAKLQWPPPDALAKQLVAQLVSKLQQSNDQDVSMALWSLSKLGTRPQQIDIEAILQHLAGKLGSYSSQSIANIAWALVGLQVQPDVQLMQQLEQEVADRLMVSTQAKSKPSAASGSSSTGTAVQPRRKGAQQQDGRAFTSQGLSNVVWAFAKLGHVPSSQMLVLAYQEASSSMSSTSPQSLSNFAWAMAKLGAQPDAVWQQQLWRFTSAAHLKSYTVHNLAMLLQAVQQMRLQPRPGWLAQLAAVAATKLTEGTPENLAVLLSGLAAMNAPLKQQQQPRQALNQGALQQPGHDQQNQHEHQHQEGYQQLMQACWRALESPWLRQATPRDISAMLRALVQLQQQPSQAAADNLLRIIFQSSPSFSPRDLVQAALAVPRLSIQPSMPWLQDYLAHLQQQLPAMNAQDLSNLLVALVELWVLPEQGWMELLLQQYDHQWNSFTPQGISNSLWALGRLQFRPSASWLRPCLAALASHVGSMSQQELANSIWALGRLKVPAERELSSSIMAELRSRAPQLSSRAIATAVWALGKMQKSSQLQQDELCSTITTLMLCMQLHLSGCSPQDFSNTLWALAKLEMQPPKEWLQEWVAASASKLDLFSGQAIANAVWALVKLKHKPDEAWVHSCLTRMHFMPEGQASEQDWSTLQVALYKWGYISEDGEYEELGDGRMVFTANIDEALLSQEELQQLQQEDEYEEAYEEGPWGHESSAVQHSSSASAVEMAWYGVDGGSVEVSSGIMGQAQTV